MDTQDIILGFISAQMMEALTAVLILVTALYALITFRILKANQDVVNVMREQSEAIMRPYVTVRPFFKVGNPILFLVIKNTGKTQATNLRLTIDRDFYQFAEDRAEGNLANLTAFKQPIKSFAPDSELTFYLATAPQLYSKDVRPERTPLAFSITAEYGFQRSVVSETTTIDLQQFSGTVLGEDRHETKLKEIADKLDTIGRSIQKLH